MGEERISREQVLQRLGISADELDRLIFEGRISPVQEEGGQQFRAEEVDALRAEVREGGEPEPGLEGAEAGKPEEEAFFDFTEELELEAPQAPVEAETEVEAPVTPPEAAAEEEAISGVLEGEEEEEADILAEILEEEETAEEMGEETVPVAEAEEETSEITRLEEETYEGEEVEEVITAEEELGYAEEAEEEEFEIPYGVPVAAEAAAPAGPLMLVLLILTVVALAWAAIFVSESVLGTSSALTNWCAGLF